MASCLRSIVARKEEAEAEAEAGHWSVGVLGRYL